MATLQDYINNVRELVHDTNSADFTNATLTNFINQARTRVAMDTHCVRGFLSVTGGNALCTIAQQENYTYNGTVGGVTVNAGGANYTNPQISFSGGGGSGAAAQAVVVNGEIQDIFMRDWGQGYGSVPAVAITDATGTGASATATPLLNVLDILSITVLWGNQRVTFRWCPFTMFQTYFRAYVNTYDVPSAFTMHQGIQQVFLSAVPDAPYVMEWDIITLPAPLVNLADIDAQVIAPANDAVQLFAAHLCLASLQNYSMADYWYSGNMKAPGKYDLRIKQLFATSQGRRIYNPYRTFYSRIKRM